jgi:mercuric ion binding protein
MNRARHLRVIVASVALVLLVVVLAAVTACRRDTEATASASAERTVAARTVAVPVDGMICQICAGSVKSALKKVDGVQDAEISLEKRHAVIHFDDRKVSIVQLTRAIKDAGFKPGAPTAVQ